MDMRILSQEKRKQIEELLTRGGRVKSKGYILLRMIRNKKIIKMKRSRAYFQYFYRIELEKSDIIHHSDKNKLNDDLANLQLMNQEEHSSLHHAGQKKITNHNPQNKLSIEKIMKIKELSKLFIKKDGTPNYSNIAKEVGVSDLTVARYLK